jgi:predicted acetyltransferase
VGLRLEQLGDAHRVGYQAMVRESIDVEGWYPHNDGDLALADWTAFLADIADEQERDRLPPGVEPQIAYAGVTADGDVVGEFRLRPWLAEPFARDHGHLGYNVRHAFRGKGIASTGLRLLRLIAGSERGLRIVVFDVEESNAISQRVARANGGQVVARDGETLWFACPTLISGRGRGR